MSAATERRTTGATATAAGNTAAEAAASASREAAERLRVNVSDRINVSSQPGIRVLAESTALARARLAAAGRQATGSVLFSGNQVSLSLGDADSDAPASAVVVMSNGDVSFSDNQVDAAVPVTAGFINTLVFGATVRVIGNRFNEPMQDARDTVLSAATIGAALNITSGNEGAHCFYAYRRPNSPVPRVVDQPNLSIIQLTNADACGRFSAAAVRIDPIMTMAWPQFASMQQSDQE